MGDLSRLVGATGPASVRSAVTAMVGDDARLFAVDPSFHELTEVVPESGSPVTFELDGALRVALLASRALRSDGVTWIPIPERGHTVFAVRTELDVDAPAVDGRALGSIMRGHRSRFEDLEVARRREAMSVAAEIQWDYLPVRADELGPYRVGGVLEPAYSVAGDMFDYAVNDGRVWAYSLDGMGHGLEATMSTMMAVGAIRNARRRGLGLTEQMNAASDTLYEHHGGDRFVTAVGCCLDGDRIDFVNAGHEPVRTVIGGEVERLDLVAELPLGIVESHDYRIQSIDPPGAGDGVVMVSDGVAGARSPTGAEFTPAGLDRILADRWSSTPLEVVHHIIDEVMVHIDGGDVGDDISAVVLTFAGDDRA